MAWAKLHTDILGDDKLLTAAADGSRHLQLLPWLIAFAKRAEDGGRLTTGGKPARSAIIANLIPDATARTVDACMVGLEAIGVLVRDEDGALCFQNWEKRSGGKPSDDPSHVRDRVKRYREKKRPNETPSNANGVTPGNALHVTRGNAIEVEVEVEGEVEGEVDTERERVTSGFAVAWAVYPKRAGGNSRHDAEKAWIARAREGVDLAVMLDGTRRYRAYCDAQAQTGTQFVMQAARFYGPSKHYEEPWAPADEMPAMYAANGVDYTPEWLAWAARTAPNGKAVR